MKNKSIFILLIIFMFGTIAFAVIAKHRLVDKMTTSKQYVDTYVSNIDNSFVYDYSETLENNSKQFYYVSEKYSDFVLTVNVRYENGKYRIVDNFNSLSAQQDIVAYMQDFFGKDVLIDIRNSAELNTLPTLEETLSYNDFELNIGIKLSDDIETIIDAYIQKIIDNGIDCSVYFYYLLPEQFDEYSQTSFDIVEGKFENYVMVIIRNKNVDTKIKYN